MLKNKFILIIGLCIFIIGYISYILFLKKDPVKEAKEFAKNYCSCSEDFNTNNLIALQKLEKEFSNFKFKTQSEAQKSIDVIYQENEAKYNECIQKNDIKYKESYADFGAKGGQNVYNFDQTYNLLINACKTADGEVTIVQNKINDKISLLPSVVIDFAIRADTTSVNVDSATIESADSTKKW